MSRSASVCAAVLVEAFTSTPLQGNGAAVVLLPSPARADWMQALAASFRQSETAFLWHCPRRGWCLRWFTPTCEVPLCGHATLAASLALAHWQHLAPGGELVLASRSGGLSVRLASDGLGAASLVLPSGTLEPQPIPPELSTLIGAPLRAYWHSALGYCVGLLDEGVDLVGLPSPAAVLREPERRGLVLMQALSAPAGEALPSILGARPDYQLRFFAPGLGIEEDPVTGSAHALVAPWWMRQLGRNRVAGWQCSSRRGGMLCELVSVGHVRLSGNGHLLWDGQIEAGPLHADGDGWQVCQSALVPS